VIVRLVASQSGLLSLGLDERGVQAFGSPLVYALGADDDELPQSPAGGSGTTSGTTVLE